MLQQKIAGQGAPVRGRSAVPPEGLMPGTIVFTLDGALPVEVLVPGDRIVTRAGARILREVTVLSGGQGFILSFDQPEVIYADGVELLAA